MEIVIVFTVVFLSAVFSLMEAAINTSRQARVEAIEAKGEKPLLRPLIILQNSTKYLSALQMGITLCAVILGVYCGLVLSPIIEPFFLQNDTLRPYAWSLSLGLITFGVTTLIITLGELIPKAIAYRNSEQWLILLAPAITLIGFVMRPFSVVYDGMTQLILRLLGKSKPSEKAISEDELMHMIDQANQQGVIEQKENEFIQNIMRFADRDAYSIMTPRNELVWVDINAPATEISAMVKESGYTKFLVCDRSLENILGVLRLRDFIENERKARFELRSLLHKPVYVPESTDALKVIELFKRRRNYFAVVVDEFGSTQGVITLHDLTENIFGNLPDLEDTVEQEVIVRDDGSLLVDGQIPVDELRNQVDISDFSSDSLDYSTLAGFILSKIDDIPVPGQRIVSEGYIFEIVDMDRSKIDKVLILRDTQAVE
jgi:putative hemolysin